MSEEITIQVVDCVGVPKDTNTIKPPRTSKEHYPYMHSTGDKVFIKQGEKIIGIINMCMDETGEVLNMDVVKV